MCIVSMVGDTWKSTFPDRWPNINPTYPYVPNYPEKKDGAVLTEYVTKQEFEALRREMQELRELLLAAKKYDEATGQKDCEMEEKIAFIKKIAEAVGVDMKDVFGK